MKPIQRTVEVEESRRGMDKALLSTGGPGSSHALRPEQSLDFSVAQARKSPFCISQFEMGFYQIES